MQKYILLRSYFLGPSVVNKAFQLASTPSKIDKEVYKLKKSILNTVNNLRYLVKILALPKLRSREYNVVSPKKELSERKSFLDL